MSNVPSSWSVTLLGDLLVELRNGVFVSRPGIENTGRPILRISAVRPMTLHDDDVRYIPTSTVVANEVNSHIDAGDLLFTRYSGNPEYVGACARVRHPVLNLLYPDKLIRGRVIPGLVDPGYLEAMMSAPQTRAVIRRLIKTTAGQVGISGSDLRSVPVPLAPYGEQLRIIAAIEEQFSRLDAGVAALERARQNLKQMRDAIRFAATQGQLVPQDPNNEPAARLIARVKPTGRFRGSRSLPGDLGPLPLGWSWALMGALAQKVTVGHVGPMKDEYVVAGVPFLRSQNVREDRFDPRGLRFIRRAFHERLSKSRLTPGDLVVVRSGNVGIACVVPDSLGEANCADLVIVQRPEAVDPHYAALYMNSLARSRIRAGRVGVALTHFNTQSVAELPVPVPPMSEQKRIVAKAQRLMSVVDSLEADLIKGLRKASALRSSILASAFSGRLVAQDPTEESASILLKRTAVERPSSNGHGPKRGRKPRVLQEGGMT